MSSDTELIQKYFPFSLKDEHEILKIVERQQDMSMFVSLPPKVHTTLLSYFFDRQVLIDGLYDKPGITFLMQSFVFKLRCAAKIRQEYLKLIKRFSVKFMTDFTKIAPATVIHAYYTILETNPNFEQAKQMLNSYPTLFVSLILQALKKNKKIDLLSCVWNPEALQILAEKLPSEKFLEFFDKDASQYSKTDKKKQFSFYSTEKNQKKRFFNIVSNQLVISAAKRGTLDVLLEKSPEELKLNLPQSIFSIVSRNPLPKQLIPFIPELAIRYSCSIFGSISDGLALITSIKIFVDTYPDKVNEIATLISRNPQLWHQLGDYLNDLPLLGQALCQYIPMMFTQSPKECLAILPKMQFTDDAATLAISKIYTFPGSFDAILACSKAGDVSFRSAAVIATKDDNNWNKFCSYYRGKAEYVGRFNDICQDHVINGNFKRCIILLHEVVLTYMNNDPNIAMYINGFVFKLRFNESVLDDTLVRKLYHIFVLVHRHVNYIFPLAQEIEELPGSNIYFALNLIRVSNSDETPDFILYRLRFYINRIKSENPPLYWSDQES